MEKTAQQLDELVILQRELLDAAAQSVQRGGVLVYATCSLEREENENQARAFVERNVDFQLEESMQMLPPREGCDGAFAARFRRN